MRLLSNHRILVVEDEALIAYEIEESIKEAGGIVAGPFATVPEALLQIEKNTLSAAVLDMQLGEDTSLAIARRLAEKNIPFLFYTAYSETMDQWIAVQIVKKPATSAALVSALAGLIGERPGLPVS